MISLCVSPVRHGSTGVVNGASVDRAHALAAVMRCLLVALPLLALVPAGLVVWTYLVADARHDLDTAADHVQVRTRRALEVARRQIASLDHLLQSTPAADLASDQHVPETIRRLREASPTMADLAIVLDDGTVIDGRDTSTARATLSHEDRRRLGEGSVAAPSVATVALPDSAGPVLSVSAPASRADARDVRIVATIDIDRLARIMRTARADGEDTVLLARRGAPPLAIAPGNLDTSRLAADALRAGARHAGWADLFQPSAFAAEIGTRDIGEWPLTLVYARSTGTLRNGLLGLMVPLTLLFAIVSFIALVLLFIENFARSDGSRGARTGTHDPRLIAAHLSDATLEAVTCHSDAALIQISLDGSVRSFNPAAQRMLGYAPAEAIGSAASKLLGHKDTKKIASALHVASAGQPLRLEEELRHKDGRRVPALVTYAPVRDATGAARAVQIIARDLTAHRHVQTQIAEAGASLSLSMQASHCGVVEMAESGFHEGNEAFARLACRGDEPANADAPRALGERLLEALRADPDFLPELRIAGAARSTEMKLTRPDGSRLDLVVTAVRTSLAPLRWIGFVVDLSDRASREERMRETMGEMTHRSKNMLTVVRSLARQIAHTSQDMESFDRRFSDRLIALAAAQDVLMRQDWTVASLHEIVAAQIAHVGEHLGTRLNLTGPELGVDARAARAIGMAVHELATNATKYGALSREEGRVDLSWTYDPSAVCPVTISWCESGGPRVVAPTTRGFGQVVVETITARSLGAKVRYDFLPGGVEWELGLPADYLVNAPGAGRRAA